MRYLPPPIEVPSFFKCLGFEQIPSGPEDVKDRYRALAKQMHPDAGGEEDDFLKLKGAAEKSMDYFEKAKA
jgi:curved DNA-binding protein CbpA